MTTYYYYCDAFSNRLTGWGRTGSSPYLDAIDYSSNYIYSLVNIVNQEIGDFGFADSGAESAETIDSVFIENYCRGYADPDFGPPPLYVYVWDGASWNYAGGAGGAGWAWRSLDISAIIDSWAKVDSLLMYLKTSTFGDIQLELVDCARIKVNTVTPTAANPIGNLFPLLKILGIIE